ncbi:phosphatase 2C-like domain-containing protein [Scenedesmus sp. NREL 46B-D3]|nr:phosphatase 2C-like domain-containing protein [Scenedesmus sp. NREL 46B-D3]
MGCVTSKQVEDDRIVEPDLRPAHGSNTAETTRARRLSYSIEAKARQQQLRQPPAFAVVSEDDKGADGTTDNKGGSATARGRRLSYVTNDKNLADKIKAEYAMYAEDDSSPQQQPATAAAAAAAAAGGSPKPQPQQAKKQRPIDVQVVCMSRAGREPGYKKTNQDNCFAFEKYITEEQAMFGAMDGHGPHGHLVSGFVKQHLPILLVQHLTSGLSLKEALSTGFLDVDAGLAGSNVDCEFSGSTCSLAHLKGTTLTTAWVGDSRMVLGRQGKRGSWEAVDVSHDHKPTLPEEKSRILKQQGRVERLVDEMGQPMGPYRVWLQYAWIPGLAMSRALGDQLAHTVGVSSEPQHVQLELTPADKLLILASDGVWEFISSKEAVELVGGCATPEEGCRLLVDEAHQRWLHEEEGVVDDITAVVVRLVHTRQ